MELKPWRSLDLGKVVTFQRGFDLPHQLRKTGDVPIVSSAGTTDYHDAAMVSPPGVVTGRYGTIGELFYLEEPFWPLNTTLFVRDFHGNDPQFVFHLLHLFDFQTFSGKSGVPGVNRNDLHAEQVTVPVDVVEQSAIAAALSDVDALLSGLDKLIAKKRALKQSAMQQLLTGKTRLPGFVVKAAFKYAEVGVIPEGWEISTFRDIVRSYVDYRGRTPRKLGMDWGGGEILALSANNVQMGRIAPEKDAYFGSEDLYRKWMRQGECERGDILLTMEAPLGNVARIPDDRKYILSQRVLLIKPNARIRRDYLYHLMRGGYFQDQLDKHSTGSTAKGIQRAKLDELSIWFPNSEAEQVAIAEVLSDMDRELDALEERRNKTRALKQGMMQQLLTGKTRLV